ncbi:unnamed protein product (macronuclear) [Paramecium tetraurelia]|uniref:Cilium assembly protein DZIP1 N-terminal domain-containing protein n=1 Tax=Paramecium tetraurelia TaxID=5888 RepID=A0DXI5_PARTE|nr:uncharacterized protein GSPATT00039826001 [Paramecium tetraurelia]CAK87752.1 unnamed protein product [Paramecium tetraurelia]|eukprot:XP_001455149.1 hypothetical protein (macronuclear) [Paramecium tetraurelia strain d4-2]
MQPSLYSKDDYFNQYVNKLLKNTSYIHMNTCEVKIPTRRNSMIDSYYLTNDTNGIQKLQIDKNRSCSNLQNYYQESSTSVKQLQNSQLSVINKNSQQIMLRVEDKLMNFKFAKENDQNISTSTIAKMKYFGQDYQFFDFYSCTDLLLLKYLIYLLLEEIYSFNQNQTEQQPIHSQKKSNTVDELKNNKHRNSIETLGKQINKMQKLIGEKLTLPNYEMFATPQSNIKKSEFMIQPSSSTQKLESDYTQTSYNSQKMIQFQIDELKIKNQTITKQTSRINSLELELKLLNNQISESDLNLQILQKTLTVKDQELKDLIKKNEKLIEASNQAFREKDEFQEHYRAAKDDYELLRTKFNDLQIKLNELQKSNQSILKESSQQKKQLTDSVQSSQQQMKKEEQKLQKELLDKNKLIRQLSEDGKILGQYLKDISYKIQQIPANQIPQNLQTIQRELCLNECLINTKLNNMHLAQIDLVKFNKSNNQEKKPRKYMNCHNQLIDQMKSFQVHSDLMAMMLIQSEIIEKFIT